jgi:hypothetical protein
MLGLLALGLYVVMMEIFAEKGKLVPEQRLLVCSKLIYISG